MSDINPIVNDRVKFTIYHPEFGPQVIDEPAGWDNTDEKEWSRNEEYDGIFAKFSNQLKFGGSSQDYIDLVFEMYDINTDLRLKKEVKHPKTDRWFTAYDGYLDLSTREKEHGVTSIKFNSGGLEEVIKSRESDEVELSRLTTMDGQPINPLKTEIVALDGRKIFLKSKWTVDANNTDDMDITVFSDDGNTRDRTEAFPFEKLVYKSQEEAQEVTFATQGDEDNGDTGMMLVAIVDRERTFQVKGENVKFKTVIHRGQTPIKEYDWCYFKVCLTIYENGTDYDMKNRIVLEHYGENSITHPNLASLDNHTFLMNFDQTVTLQAGESLAFEFLLKADLASGGGRRVAIRVRDRDGFMNVYEDSTFRPTTAKFILAYEAFDRILEIITGKKGILKSKFLGRTDIGYDQDGPAALNGLTHGFWIRNFDELPVGNDDNPNLFKPLTTSFKNSCTSFNAVWNTGLGIERIGYQERVIIEDKKYFYNRNVTIKLPLQVKNEKRTVATKYYISGIDIGYEKGGSYDEAMGLDEANGRASFNSIIRVVKGLFVKISQFRSDPYGKEFCRRKQIDTHPTEDTPYDTDIHLMDLKRGPGQVFQERKWQDDFAQAPTGIYSPETATNLRLSPFNMMLRHGWEIAAGLVKYPLDYIRYSSSTANSKLKTKLIGGIEYSENGNIRNSELQKARYIGEFVEFEHELDYDLIQSIEAYQMINGEKVYNMYGLVEFINSKNQVDRGWIMNLKPGDKGKWKLLTFNKN